MILGPLSMGMAVAVAGVVDATPVPSAVHAARRVAVLVGVQEYTDPALRGLRFPAKDAHDLASALQSPDVGGFDRVFVVDGASGTTRAELLRAISVAAAELQRDDTFVLYLSGHGTLTIDPAFGSRLWFLPSDGALNAPERTGISVAELESMVHSLPARRRVLILDTCHNGRSGSKSLVAMPTAKLLQSFRGDPPAPRDIRDVSESEARLYAAQYYQPAMEDSELQNGVYTHYLIEGLGIGRGTADLDGDGLVDVTEAHEYARDRTINFTGGIQVPRAEYRIVGREEIYLSGKKSERSAAEQALVSACDLVLQRARLLINGVPRGELPGLYAVEPGLQSVEVQTADGKTIFKERVAFAAGHTMPIEDLLKRHRPSVSALTGVSFLAGVPEFNPWMGSLLVSVANPIRLSGPWRPELHAAIDLGGGDVADGRHVTSGAASVGAMVGVTAGAAYLGPAVDLRVPFRGDGQEWQGDPTGAGAMVAGVTVPLGARLFADLRADGYVTSIPIDDRQEIAWGAGLRVGLGSVK